MAEHDCSVCPCCESIWTVSPKLMGASTCQLLLASEFLNKGTRPLPSWAFSLTLRSVLASHQEDFTHIFDRGGEVVSIEPAEVFACAADRLNVCPAIFIKPGKLAACGNE